MSWLSDRTGIHINLKPVAPAIGAIIGSAVPGVGTALGAGLGRTLSGLGNGESVGKAALGGVLAGGGASVLGGLASKVPGVSAISTRAKSILGAIPGLGGGGSSGSDVFTDDGGSPDQGILQNIKNEAGRVVGRLANGQSPISVNGGDPTAGGGEATGGTGTGGGGGTSALDKLLLGGSVAAGAADALDRRNFRNKASQYVTESYDARAPMRARALELLKQDQPRDLSSIFANPGNVYDRQRRAQAIAAPAASPPAY